jgi:hypothetical protein
MYSDVMLVLVATTVVEQVVIFQSDADDVVVFCLSFEIS